MKEEAAGPEASAGNAASERRLGTPLFFLSSSFAPKRRSEGSESGVRTSGAAAGGA